MINTKLTSLSVFFPVYNEEANIGLVIEDAVRHARKIAKIWEVIIVDDGSHDATREIVHTYSLKYPEVRLVSHKTNKGYGAAVKTGLAACHYDWCFFSDSDGQFHFDELASFVARRDEADFVIGYRAKRQDHLMRLIVAQGLLRTWNYLLFGIKVRDIDCAYKLIPRRCLDNLKLTTASAITVTELIYRLLRQNYTYIEVPVTHYPRKYGLQTGNNPRVIIRALCESLMLWWKLVCGQK
jgi:glycosyltransferase involved in cell wall biosynthesis